MRTLLSRSGSRALFLLGLAVAALPAIAQPTASTPAAPDRAGRRLTVGVGALPADMGREVPERFGQVGLEWQRAGSKVSVRAQLMGIREPTIYGLDESQGCEGFCEEFQQRSMVGAVAEFRYGLLRRRVTPYVMSGSGLFMVRGRYRHVDRCPAVNDGYCTLGDVTTTTASFGGPTIGLTAGLGLAARVRSAVLFAEVRELYLTDRGFNGQAADQVPLVVGLRF